MKTGPKVLFLLAGYSGVGKSTLLARAIQGNLPIFGQEFHPTFMRTRAPTRDQERALNLAQTLEQGFWLTHRRLPALARLQEPPPHLVMHIDLVSFISDPPPLVWAQGNGTTPRDLALLADTQANEAAVRQGMANEFFAKFDLVLVNTLYAPWEVTAQRWRKRLSPGAAQATRRYVLFDPDAPRPDIHKAVHAAWLRGHLAASPKVSLVSWVHGDRLRFRDLLGPQGGKLIQALP